MGVTVNGIHSHCKYCTRPRPQPKKVLLQPLRAAHEAWAKSMGVSLAMPLCVDSAPATSVPDLAQLDQEAFPIMEQSFRVMYLRRHGRVSFRLILQARGIEETFAIDSLDLASKIGFDKAKKPSVIRAVMKLVPGDIPARSRLFVWADHEQLWYALYGDGSNTLNDTDQMVCWARSIASLWMEENGRTSVGAWTHMKPERRSEKLKRNKDSSSEPKPKRRKT